MTNFEFLLTTLLGFAIMAMISKVARKALKVCAVLGVFFVLFRMTRG